MPDQLVEDLSAARDFLKDEDNWCPRGLSNNGENACIVGALNKVCFGSISVNNWTNEGMVRRGYAIDALYSHLPERNYYDEGAGLAHYNDLETTLHPDVMMLFDKTLADLGA